MVVTPPRAAALPIAMASAAASAGFETILPKRVRGGLGYGSAAARPFALGPGAEPGAGPGAAGCGGVDSTCLTPSIRPFPRAVSIAGRGPAARHATAALPAQQIKAYAEART